MEGLHKEHRSKKSSKSFSGNNPRAFTFHRSGKAERSARRAQDVGEKRLHVPAVDRTRVALTPPPLLVAIVGPPGTGKSTLIKSLVRHYVKHTLFNPLGPITCVASKKLRISLLEVPASLNCMLDVAKIADLVILTIDGNYGMEMETMEFLSIVASQGQTKVLAVLTHLDLFKNPEQLKAAKSRLKRRIWRDLYPGAKVFYLSGVINGRYPDREIINLARFISVMKVRPIKFTQTHSFILCDRWEDITPPLNVAENPNCERTVSLYGYVRGGATLRESQRVHIPGVKDFLIDSISSLPDPCALERKDGEKRKKLSERMKKIYAPMSDVGGVLFDKDAVYVEMPEKNTGFTQGNDEVNESIGLGERMVRKLQRPDSLGHFGSFSLFSSDVPDFGRTTVRKGILAAVEENILNDGIEEESVESQQFDEGSHHILQDETEERPQLIKEDFNFADSDSDLGDLSENDYSFDEKENIQLRANKQLELRQLRKLNDLNQLVYSSNSNAEVSQLYATSNGIDVTFDPYESTEANLNETVHLKSTVNDEDDFFSKRGLPEDELIENHHDGSRPKINMSKLQTWSSETKLEALKERFNTFEGLIDVGKIEDNPEFNEFEDLETEVEAEVDKAEAKNTNVANDSANGLTFDAERELNAKRKQLAKMKFEELEDAQRDILDTQTEEGDVERTWQEEQKLRLSKQLEVNVLEMRDLDEDTRASLEGYHSGQYVRLVITGMPCEFAENFNPQYPVIVGGLLNAEEGFGYLQVRIKKHRWHKKLLKNNDPLIFSVGWRRYQSIPVYSISDSRTRNRMLKYTPDHMHCFASFYGPLSVGNTGFCAVQSVAKSATTGNFRVAATGIVLDGDQSTDIVKKLKLTGVPYKIYKNTAFIKDMFNSIVEVAKFEGANIRTVSGIRGQVKKAVSKPEGAFRATFEDKVLLSDIVFLRTWYPIRPRKFYNPVTSLLLENKEEWIGMRLTGQVRYAEGLKVPIKPDAIYRDVERTTRRFNPLKVPKALQSNLPFASKQRIMKPQRNHTYMQKRAVVLGDEEKRARDLIQQVLTLRNEKEQKRSDKKAVQQRDYELAKSNVVTEKMAKEKLRQKEYWERAGKRKDRSTPRYDSKRSKRSNDMGS